MSARGYGLARYGTAPYGAVGDELALSSAFAATTRSVRVSVAGEPRAHSAFVAGDALNPATWRVRRLDSNALLQVVAVAQIDDATFDVVTLEAFGPASVTHRVSTDSLRSALGSLIPEAANTADFPGVSWVETATPARAAAARRFASIDLANAQVPTADAPGGTLRVSTSGDYQEVDGPEMVRKLVMRRLLTRRGEFFHLPDYGINLDSKGLYTVADRMKLKTEIVRQVKREPEVEDCSATITGPDKDGVLGVDVRVKLRATGQKLDVALSVPANAIAL